MKTLSKKNIVLAVLMLAIGSQNLKAQSTVYFFVRSSANSEITLKKNGQDLFEMRGNLKKTIKPTSPMKLPLYNYFPAFRKCEFKDEGKVLFGVENKYTNCVTEEVTTMAGEIQINLSEGSIHYLYITSKGLNDIQFKEITEKEALKMMKEKKRTKLEDYIEQ